MVPHPFDRLTQSLTTRLSRRGVERIFLGASVLGLLGSTEVEAKRKKKKACLPCKKRKQGKCKATLPDGTVCPGGTCQSGSCIPTPSPPCPTGQKVCRGSCIPNDRCCTAGECAAGETCCDGNCRNLQTDEANCGSCGTVCAANEVCQPDGEGASCFPTGVCSAPKLGFCSGGVSWMCDAGADGCYCMLSVEGNVLCLSALNFVCPPVFPACTTSADCAAGKACVDVSSPECCGAGVKACMPKCPAPA